jgi:hypothetical protein
VRGASSRGFAQKSYAVELWGAGNDEDWNAAWLGMPAESDWVLAAPGDIDRSLMRTRLPMDLSRKIGVYAPRTRSVEVFLVDREGADALSLDDYVGVYTATEKISRDSFRVPVAKLEAEDSTPELVTGGYIFRIDHGGEEFNAGGYGFQWVYPDADLMTDPAREPQVDFLTNEIDDFFAALYASDFTHPDNGQHYSEYIDPALWIDHNLLVALCKNVDGLRLSAYFYKDRGGPIVAGPVWDFDRSLGTPHDDRAESPTEWGSGDGTQPLTELFWGRLFEDETFAAAYWSRWDQLKQDAFSVPALLAMVDSYDAELAEARERHFERWSELPPQDGPAGEVQILRDFLSDRVPWIDSQRP